MSLCSHDGIAKYWSQQERLNVEYGYPGCFACGYFDETKSRDLDVMWRTCGLQKCHIVARSEGGVDFAYNIVLLCQSCHIKAPMTVIPEVMLRWIESQESMGYRLYLEVVESVRSAGVKDGEMSRFKKSGFLKFLQGIKYDKHPWGRGSFLSFKDIGPMIRLYLDCIE